MGTFQSFRKAYGALKDSTKVGLAKVNSEFKVQVFFLQDLHNYLLFLLLHISYDYFLEKLFTFLIIFISLKMNLCFLINLKGFGYCHCQSHKSRWMPSKRTPRSKWVHYAPNIHRFCSYLNWIIDNFTDLYTQWIIYRWLS